ncbi:response regulator transcription factor [Mesorhizobium sp. A556]
MSIDVEGLFAALGDMVGKHAMADAEFGGTFRRMMQALVRFDHIVVFAYNGAERPIDLYSDFDRNEHVVFVALYQVGPYLLDPFYHTARERREGVFRMRELAPDRFFSSEYYRTYYVKTGLAEEIGFFIPTGDGTTVVLSLMRREESGPFPAADFALLRKAEPLVAIMVRQYWAKLADRFENVASGSRRGRKATGLSQVTDAVWQGLKLSPREATIVELVLQGHSSESIGLKLGIATGTVKVHRRNVYRKLGISSQTQLLSIYLKSLN